MKIYSIKGNYLKLDGGSMFGNAPKVMWKNWIKADRYNRIKLASRALLIQTGDINILCETGIGTFLEPEPAGRFGVDLNENSLIKNLDSIGIGEKDIHYVILSHMHFDHIGGLISGYNKRKKEWKFHFPKARYIISLENFTHASHPHYGDRASFISGLGDSLKNTGRLILINEAEPHEFEGIIKFVFSDGHTPGQLLTIVEGKKEKIFFAGDLIPGIPWINLPITMGFDRFPEKLIDEKKIYLEEALHENWLIFFIHDPVYAAARVTVDSKGKYRPLDPVKNLKDYSID